MPIIGFSDPPGTRNDGSEIFFSNRECVFMPSVLDRFLEYVQISTQAASGKDVVPSTPGQMIPALKLGEELRAPGLSGVIVDEHAYVTATLPANTEKKIPVIAFNAHLDTALEVTDDTVRPRLVEDYDGGDILLNEKDRVVLSPSIFPDLLKYKGKPWWSPTGQPFPAQTTRRESRRSWRPWNT